MTNERTIKERDRSDTQNNKFIIEIQCVEITLTIFRDKQDVRANFLNFIAELGLKAVKNNAS